MKKRCVECKEELDIKDFNIHRGMKDGRQVTCRPCQKHYRETHREYYRSYMKKYYAEHKEYYRRYEFIRERKPRT